MTNKGQITIPHDIRKYLNLRSGDRVDFFIGDDGNVVIIPITVDISELKGIAPKPKKSVSIDDMNKAICKRK
jgi:AbrB family looped-hinge helix DNA binding protein